MGRRLFRLMIYLMLLLPLGYLLICGFLYFQQDEMVFRPRGESWDEAREQVESEGFLPWTNADGDFFGWQSREGDPSSVLLVLNGNAGTASGRLHYRANTQKAGDWKVFLLEYPGYGSRTGMPSEASLTAAATEAVDLLARESGRTIWLLGESLGSGVASATARERPQKIAGLILVTPFNSLSAAAGYHYPWLPVGLFLRTRFASDENLSAYPGPVAFFLGAKDQTVPAELGQKLYDGYQGRKRLWIDPVGDHNVSGLVYHVWPELVSWLDVKAEEKPDPKGAMDGSEGRQR